MISGVSTISYSLADFNGNTVPAWVTLNAVAEKLVVNAPSLTTDTSYTFAIQYTVSGNAQTFYKPVHLTVIGYIPPPVVVACTAQN